MLSPLCSSHRPFIVTRERSKGNGSYKLVSVIFIVGAADRKFPHAVNFKHWNNLLTSTTGTGSQIHKGCSIDSETNRHRLI